jgi:hypothetical protein
MVRKKRLLVFAGVLILAVAGNPTKNEKLQPGAAGASVVDAADFDSLQEAIDALPEGGGTVELPAGRFEITAPLTCSLDDVCIRGQGSATHIVNLNEEGKPALSLSPPEGKKSIWRVQLCDFRVTGNPKSGPGILARAVDEILLSRVASEHNGTDGVVLDHCYEDPRVVACLFNYNAQIGLNLLGCHDIVVSANQFEENMDALHCVDGYNLTMTGNNLDDHLGNGVVIRNTYGSVVTGNMIEECNGHGLVLGGACYGDTVSANTFAHCQGDGLRLEGVRDITISANTFVLLADQSIRSIDGAAQLTITGNTFCRYPFDPTKRHKVDPGSGLLFSDARDVTINGNIFTNTREEAIKTTGDATTRFNITGNTILDAWQDPANRGPAISLVPVDGCVIANNIVTDTREREWDTPQAIAIEGEPQQSIIKDNVIAGFAES